MKTTGDKPATHTSAAEVEERPVSQVAPAPHQPIQDLIRSEEEEDGEPSHAPDAEEPLAFFNAPLDQKKRTKSLSSTIAANASPAHDASQTNDKSTTSVTAAAPPPSADLNALPGPSLPQLPPAEPAPEMVVFYDDPDDDGYGLRSLMEAITNPQLLLRIQYGFRTILLVTFPLYTIALHPNTRYRLGFPQMLIASVVSTSTHRPTVGEQIGLHSWTWRGIIFMLIWGTAVDAWGVAYHVGAWYGLLAAGVFSAGLVNNGNMRRFMYLYFFLYMLELRTHQHYFSYVPMNDAAYSALDYLIGSLMGVAANTIPFPSLVRDTVDMIMTKIFGGFGKLLFGMLTYTWSPDVHAAAFFFDDRTPFITIEAVLSHMSALLWFTSWEPMEFPLRNPIRRLKLSLLRRIMALGYAAFSCGRTIARFRQEQADRAAMHAIRCQLYEAAHGTEWKAIGDAKDPVAALNKKDSDHSTPHVSDSASGETKTAKDSIAALRANSYAYVKDFGLTLMQTVTLIGSTESTPEQLLKKVPFDALREKQTLMRRNLRLELVQVMKIQSDMVARQRAREQAQQKGKKGEEDDESESDDEKVEKFDSGKERRDKDGNVPFGRGARYNIHRADALLLLQHREVIDSFEVFLRINEIFLHLLMGMIAGELINFGEQMKEYKPTESLFCRWWNHYIVEAWNGFWEELWYRITLARPTDLRTVKDAIRMTCAYLSAVALSIELWKPLNGLYFFGVTPLLGLPVEEESLGIGLCRIGGNTLGCALGYLAYHNTTNFAQQIAMTLCFAFVQQICKYHAQYGQFFFYGSVITLAGLATAMIFNELVVRLITSSYTVMAYLMCCLFLFPNDCRKICFNYRCKLAKVMSETIDDVALTARIAIEYTDVENADDDDEDTRSNNEPVGYPKRNTEPMLMCSQLNVELTLLERLLGMCEKWTPFAAGELVIRGMAQFPAGPNSLITYSHQRMVANLRLLVFGVQLLHRPRTAPPAPNINHLIHASLADFLDEFADAVRLVSVDYVQALQRSRTWSYPRHLSRVSQLRRLRVRLHAIMYECYVLVANNVSKGTFGMTPEDFEQMRLDAAGQGGAAPQQLQSGATGRERDDTHGHVDLSFLPGAGGNPVEGMTSMPAPPHPTAAAAKTAPGTAGNRADETGSRPPSTAHIDVSAGDDRAMNNMSFVDRFLGRRREDEELTEEMQTARSIPSQRASFAAANAAAKCSDAEEKEPELLNGATNGPSQQLSTRSFSPGQRSLPTASLASRRRPAPFVHRAQLQPSGAEPTDAYPVAIGSAEREVEQILTSEQRKTQQQDTARRLRRRQSGAPGGDDGAAVQVDAAVHPASPPPEFAPVLPAKTKSRMSKLILFPDKGPETFIPLYRGPAFTFMEDQLDVPADTDFSAITTILISCESLMAEFELLPGSLNSVVNYDKQLQESSVATALLDTWSARLAGHCKDVHDRYHYPKPPPQKRRPMHAQEDPFEDWKF